MVHLQEITTRELRENTEIQYDTIAGVLNVMGEEGRLIRIRKGEQKVLWGRTTGGNRKRNKSEEKPLKTGSRFSTGSQESKTPGSRLVDRKETTCPVENQPVPISPPLYARAGTGFFPQARKESGKYQARTPVGPNSKAQLEDRSPG